MRKTYLAINLLLFCLLTCQQVSAQANLVIKGQLDRGIINLPVVQVSAGNKHFAALQEDGTVVCWGDNSLNQLEMPKGLKDVVSIACGGVFTLALQKDGKVVGWGDSTEKKLAVPDGLMATSIVAGETFGAAIVEHDSVVVWGYVNGLEEIPKGLSQVKELHAGQTALIALKKDSTVVAWGNTDIVLPEDLKNVKNAVFSNVMYSPKILVLTYDGQLHEYGGDAQQTIPTSLPPIKEIACGEFYCLAITEDNKVVMWGDGSYGAQNLPPDLPAIKAISTREHYGVLLSDKGKVITYQGGETCVPEKVSGIKQVAGGLDHVLVLDSLGAVHGWTSSDNKQTSMFYYLKSGVKQIAAFQNMSMALMESNLVYIWGGSDISYYETMNGDLAYEVRQIALGPNHALVLKADGKVVQNAWGKDFTGLGNMPQDLSNVKAIATGQYHSLALKEDGTVVTWGGLHEDSLKVPVGLDHVKDVKVGAFFSVALKEDGTVVVWGQNIGNVLNVPKGLDSVETISAGYYHVTALRKNGKVVSWGANNYEDLSVPNLGGKVLISTAADLSTLFVVGGKSSDGIVLSTQEVSGVERGTVRVYPNPSTANARVTLEGVLPHSQIRIYSLEGVKKWQQELESTTTELSTTSLVAGTYYYDIVQESTILAHGRLIVQ